MTDIKPFKAIIYNATKVTNLANVVCPPYDVISPQEKENFYKLNEYNFIKILLSNERSKENGEVVNKYNNAKLILDNWLSNEILVSDKKEGIYFYLQEFIFKGEKKARVGFIALMRLNQTGKSVVYPHEHTRKEPKEDRLALLKKVKANLSPIFTLFSDEDHQISRIFDNYICKQEPLFKLVDNDTCAHKVWRLEDRDILKRLRDYMKDKSIVIADGHHRYEVACEYRDYMLKRLGKNGLAPSAGFNYIMSYFIDMNSRGLIVLPIHRLVKNLPKDALKRMEEFFEIEKAKDRFDLLFLLMKAANSGHAFGLYCSGSFYLIRLKKEHSNNKFLEDGSDFYNNLDVVVLNKFIFKELLSIDVSQVEFIKDETEAMESVDSGRFKAVFFLNPTKVEHIKTIALNNERMPPKSTYFYPKLLSGLLIHKF